MRKLITLSALIALAYVPAATVNASSAGVGTISNILATASGVVMFNHAGARSAAPSCQSSGVPTRWAINGATPAGQAMIATLLSAYSLGKSVQVVGTGACGDWVDTESVSLLQILD